MTEIPISEDGERASLDVAKLQYVGPPAGWAGLWPHRGKQIALRIDGDEQAPNAWLAQLAEIVLPQLAAVEDAADAYLRGFVGDDDGFYIGSWKLQSLRMRWDPGHQRVTGSEFEVTLSVGQDDYGEWAVRFVYHTYGRGYPFRRGRGGGGGVTGHRGVRGLEVKRAEGDFPAQPNRAFLHEPPSASK